MYPLQLKMYYNTQNPHGGDIYQSNIRFDFSANVNPYGAPEPVILAAKAAMDEAGLYPDPFCRNLVSGIAAKEGVSPEDVFVGNGASELIYAYCSAKRFGKALLAVPSFAEYAAALKHSGTRIRYYMLEKESGFALREDFPEIIRRERPDAVFLCNPNNPTGLPIPSDLLRKIVQTAKEEKICLFMDECFYELSDEPLTLRPELAGYKGLFILRAFTKCFALAGLRLGYCLSSDHALFEEMALFTPPWSVSLPAQKAGAAALSEEDYLAETRKKIKKERQWLEEKLSGFGFTVWPSSVNFLFFEAEPDLAEKLEKEGVLIRKCANYEGLGPGFFRIAVRTPEENKELIEIMAKVRSHV